MAKYKIGDLIKAKVTGITDYGFFVRIDETYTGLCHISEVSNDFVNNINDFVHIDEYIYALIIDIDELNKQIKISIKDIYYKIEEDNTKIKEARLGFLPLKQMLPIWIKEKLEEYKKQ